MPQNLKRDPAALKQLPTNDDIARTLWISFRDDPALSAYPAHGHAWGEFIYAFNGVMEVHIDQVDYITPPPYGIWLPPNLQRQRAEPHGGFTWNLICARAPVQPHAAAGRHFAQFQLGLGNF